MEVYSKVGKILSQYKSGKVPKALKSLPASKKWSSLLRYTSPDNWTPHATFQVVKIFIAALPASDSEKFLREFFLPKLKADYSESKEVHQQHFIALKKSLYRPSAFYKGIVLPLLEDNRVTLKQASIISSVISKSPIPMLFSAAALASLCNLPYSGPRALIMRTILDKKYALPLNLIHIILLFFEQTSHESKMLPVLWHQCLFVFVQRYKKEFVREQKTKILEILKLSRHEAISSLIEEELRTNDHMDIQ